MSSPHVARIERDAFCAALLAAGPDAPTLCEGWVARDLAAHVLVRETRPDLAIGILLGPLSGRLARGQREIAAGGWPTLVDRIRTGPPVWNPVRVPVLDDLANLVEFVVHTEDVLRGDGRPVPRRTLPAATERAVWRALVRLGPVLLRDSPVGVRLVAPGYGEIRARAGTAVVAATGSPLELLLLGHGRGRAADVDLAGTREDVAALRSARLGLG